MANATRPRAFHAVVDRLQADIFEQRYRPGDRLPSEPDLATQFGVSRTGIREALRVLEMQGLVEVRHGYGGGAFVAEPSHTPVLGALEVSLRFGQVDVQDLYQTRLLLEPAIARLAGEGDREPVAAALDENVARAEHAVERGEPASGLNVQFHLILAEHAGNRVLGLMMQALQELLQRLDAQQPNEPAVSRCAVDEHRQLVAALRVGDSAAAESLMRAHLLRLQAHVERARDSAAADPPRQGGDDGKRRVLDSRSANSRHRRQTADAPAERSERKNGDYRN